MINIRRGVLLCCLLAAMVGCDRVTKHLALTTLAGHPDHSYLADTVRLQYHENPGAFLSVGASWSPELRAVVFQIGNGLFLLALAIGASRRRWSRVESAGLVLFMAGALSNLIDRIAVGSVIDFLNVGVGLLRTGIFNLADVAIMAGAGCLFWELIRSFLHLSRVKSTRLSADKASAVAPQGSSVLASEMQS
jgi:signal peptidase II